MICNEGLENTGLPKPDRIHLLAQARRATIDDQKARLDWLLTKFGGEKQSDNLLKVVGLSDAHCAEMAFRFSSESEITFDNSA